MKRLRQLFRDHFIRLEQHGRWSFLWRSWLEATALAFVIGHAVHLLFPAPRRTDLEGLPLLQLVGLVAVIGPLFETLAFQCFPLEITAALGFRRRARLLLSILPFAAMHHFAGVPTMVAAGVVGGFYFAFTYERWRKESLIAGVLMTLLLHSSYNLTGVLSMLLLQR